MSIDLTTIVSTLLDPPPLACTAPPVLRPRPAEDPGPGRGDVGTRRLAPEIVSASPGCVVPGATAPNGKRPLRGVAARHRRAIAPLAERRVDALLEGLFRHVADDPLHEFTRPEDAERWDAHDAVPRRDPAVLVHVELHHAQLAFIFSRNFLDDRGDHLAWATPRGPKIHQHRRARLQHIGVERLLRHARRLRCHTLAPLLMGSPDSSQPIPASIYSLFPTPVTTAANVPSRPAGGRSFPRRRGIPSGPIARRRCPSAGRPGGSLWPPTGGRASWQS